MSKSKTFVLYIAKAEVQEFEHVLTEAEKTIVNAGDAIVSESDGLGSKASAYIFENAPSPPNWLSDIG